MPLQGAGACARAGAGLTNRAASNTRTDETADLSMRRPCMGASWEERVVGHAIGKLYEQLQGCCTQRHAKKTTEGISSGLQEHPRNVAAKRRRNSRKSPQLTGRLRRSVWHGTCSSTGRSV